jgi:hypothetical protein
MTPRDIPLVIMTKPFCEGCGKEFAAQERALKVELGMIGEQGWENPDKWNAHYYCNECYGKGKLPSGATYQRTAGTQT